MIAHAVTNSMNTTTHRTRISVIQENQAGTQKIAGITEYGHDIEVVECITIASGLPQLIDNPEDYLPDRFAGDLVLSFLKHPDLLDQLASVCEKQGIPLIASGRTTRYGHNPFTCCGLGRHEYLGRYGEQFGFPELTVRLDQAGLIQEVSVSRGASCGATWQAAQEITGLTPAEALINYPREVQYLCTADPSAFDPITGKSAVHYAGHVHHAALRKAITTAKK